MSFSSEELDQYLQETEDPLKTNSWSKELRDAVAEHKFIVEGIKFHAEKRFENQLSRVDEELDRQAFFKNDDLEIIQGVSFAGEQDLIRKIAQVDQRLSQEDFFKENIENKGKIRRLGSRKISALAAAIALFILAGIYFLTTTHTTTEQIFAAHFIVPNQELSELIEAEEGEVGFAAETGYSLQDLKEAVAIFDSEKYASFLQKSTPLLDDSSIAHYHDDLLFLRGLAQLHEGLNAQAISSFKQIETTTEDVYWYLGLAQLKYSGKVEALKTWEAISGDSRVKKIRIQLGKAG